MAIGNNSDDKLTQAEWAEFYRDVAAEIRQWATKTHGSWVSASTDPWQNACWVIEINETDYHDEWLRKNLTALRKRFRQDSVAYAIAETEFI